MILEENLSAAEGSSLKGPNVRNLIKVTCHFEPSPI